MKPASKSSKISKIKQEKGSNNVINKNLSPQKISKSEKIYIKYPISSKKPKSMKLNSKVNEIKEKFSLYKKELETLKNEEEKIQELKDKLKMQYDLYNNTITKNSKDSISKTNVKTKMIKHEDNFSPSPNMFRRNILDLIEKSNKNKKNHIISQSNKNIHKIKYSINQIKNKPKININLLTKINKDDLKAHSQKLKTKYNIPYETLYTVQNRKAKILFDLEKNKKGQKNKKIGILTEAGIESDNKKKINQDNYFDYDLKNGFKFIGVCDGHGENGKQVSEFIKKHLPKELEKELNVFVANERKRLSILEGMLKRNDENNSEKKEKTNIENLLDYEKLNELFKKVYISTNLQLFADNTKLNLKTSGSTCVGIFYKKNPLKKLYTANLGDSRAIIIKHQKSSSGKEDKNIWSYEALSRDHTPSETDEAERIIQYGGEIQKIQNEDGTFEGPLRIFKKNEEGPGLAMSRSFGDSEGENLGIIAEPEVKEYLIKKDDKALIIASDGLWEYTSNEEVVDIVKKLWEQKDVDKIVNELYKASIENWKKENCNIDDITIICVLLN